MVLLQLVIDAYERARQWAIDNPDETAEILAEGSEAIRSAEAHPELAAPGALETVVIRTTGDRVQDRPLSVIRSTRAPVLTAIPCRSNARRRG